MTARRRFLQAASAAAVYRLSAEPTQTKPVSANDTLSLGFIGMGIRGSYLMEEFRAVPGTKLVAGADLYDGYLTRAKEFAGSDFVTTKRYEEILNRKDLDAVVIATPDHWHRKMTLEALSAGKHVFIEKPLTWSLKDGPEIIAAEKKAGKVLMVGSGGKTATMTAKVKDLIASGTVGKVIQVQMATNRNSREGAWLYPVPPDASPQTIDWDRFIGPAPKRAFSPEVFFRWRCWWEYSGGVATDLFVHMLTTLHEVMGVRAPLSAVSQGGLWFWKDGRTVPDVLESVFEYPQQFLARLTVNLKNSAPAPAMVVQGSEGTLVWTYNNIVVTPEPEDKDVQFYGTNAWPKAARAEYLRAKGIDPAKPRGGWGERPKPVEHKVERGQSHGWYFIDSIRNNRPSRENATEGHAAAGAAHLANMAYREGRRLRWDFENNKVSGD